MNKEKAAKNDKILSVTGLKVLAVILIFIHHSRIPLDGIDLGARMCELFFIISGFLVGYKYLNNKSDQTKHTWNDSINYVKKKVKAVLPLHIICALTYLFLFVKNIFSWNTLITLAINLSLMQAWFPKKAVFFSLNGASWFLSALMFCYFLSPLLTMTLKNKPRKLVIIFVIVALIRIAMELIQVMYPGKYSNMPMHVFPPIRALEFYLGMLITPLFLKLREQINKMSEKKSFFIFSGIEILIFALATFACFQFNSAWIRGYYVLMFIPVILIIALGYGILSKMLSLKPFQWFGKIQFVFFIVHGVVLKSYFTFVPKGIVGDVYIDTLIYFITTIVVSAVYLKIETRIRKAISAKSQQKLSKKVC